MKEFIIYVLIKLLSVMMRIIGIISYQVLIWMIMIIPGVFYVKFFPEYWWRLTVATVIILMALLVSFYPKKYM